MDVVGDAIHQLQADPVAGGVKPSQLEVFDTVLEKLTQNAKNPEPYQAPAASPKANKGFLTVLKVAIIVAVIASILFVPAVQDVMDKMFPTLVSRIGAQGLLVFVVALLLIQNNFNS